MVPTILHHPSEWFVYNSTPAQNPGRVVTLVHKEDWDAFSGSVSTVAPMHAS